MDYDIQPDAQSGILRLKYCGSFSGREETRKIHSEVAAAAEEHRCSKFLVDHRNSVITSLVQAYEMPESAESAGLKDVVSRVAIVHDPKDAHLFRFLETTSLNRGFRVKVFDDEAQALEWLTTQ